MNLKSSVETRAVSGMVRALLGNEGGENKSAPSVQLRYRTFKNRALGYLCPGDADDDRYH